MIESRRMITANTAPDFQADIAAVQRIPVVSMILDVVCRMTGMGFAAIARVTPERWIACSVLDKVAFGLLPGNELAIRTTLCDEVRGSGQPIVIDSVADHPAYCSHHTPAMYGLQSYISMPIILPDGTFFGTLCAIDPKPAKLDAPEVVGMFRLFADLIAFHLDAADRLASSEASLKDERETALLREQFIAVLGHDLRNPLSAIDGGTRLLQHTIDGDRSRKVLQMIRGSAARMSGLIDNILDFARGRLGGGLDLSRDSEHALAPVVQQVVDELRASHPTRTIDADIALGRSIGCDPGRIAQLLSNLLGNALTHGDPVAPIDVRARIRGDAFELSVTNVAEPIPPDVLARLFHPFARGEVRPNQQGLGLGLYIASQIAAAHGGTLAADSTAERTRFTFLMPLA
jgi:signal transduction histidine kinase